MNSFLRSMLYDKLFSIMQDQFYTCLLPNCEFDNVTLVSEIIPHFELRDAIQSIVCINV